MSLSAAVGTGDSVVHRLPAGAKLLALLAFSVTLVALRSPRTIAVAAFVVIGGYAVARLHPSALWRQVRPLRWFVAFLIPFHLWTLGWQGMIEVVGLMVVAVAAAGLVTETTKVSAMLSALTTALKPLRIIGIDPGRVAMVLTLTIRAIPVVSQIADEARDARRARGLERSIRALVTPVVIRTISHAERTGESLIARGFDD